MKKIFRKEDNKSIFGKFLFISLYISLFIGFYYNEDSSGSGGFIADFNNTWGYVLALQNEFFVLPSEWVLHTPLHFLIISKFYPLLESKYLVRLFYCSLCFVVPLILSLERFTCCFVNSLVCNSFGPISTPAFSKASSIFAEPKLAK